jgi:hypothetical protein
MQRARWGALRRAITREASSPEVSNWLPFVVASPPAAVLPWVGDVIRVWDATSCGTGCVAALDALQTAPDGHCVLASVVLASLPAFLEGMQAAGVRVQPLLAVAAASVEVSHCRLLALRLVPTHPAGDGVAAAASQVLPPDSLGFVVQATSVRGAFPVLVVLPARRQPTLLDLVAHRSEGSVDNTGNVRVWPCEQLLAHLCLTRQADVMDCSVVELGSGMCGAWSHHRRRSPPPSSATPSACFLRRWVPPRGPGSLSTVACPPPLQALLEWWRRTIAIPSKLLLQTATTRCVGKVAGLA